MRAMTRVALVLLLVAACGGGNQITREQAKEPGQLLFNGYTKSEIHCFECHDGSAKGTKYGPALGPRVASLTDDQLTSSIMNGKGKMPAFKGKLGDADVKDIIAWLRGSFGAPATGGPAPAAGSDAGSAAPATTL